MAVGPRTPAGVTTPAPSRLVNQFICVLGPAWNTEQAQHACHVTPNTLIIVQCTPRSRQFSHTRNTIRIVGNPAGEVRTQHSALASIAGAVQELLEDIGGGEKGGGG